MMSRALPILSCVLFLGGCTVGPDFTVPKPPDVAGYAAKGDEPAPSDQTVKLGQQIAGNWWDQFHSRKLDTVIRAALAGNQDIAAAKARMAEARQAVNAAEGAQLPSLSLDGTAGRQKYGVALFGPANFKIPAFTYYSIGPSVSFPLDLFGGQRRTVEEKAAYRQYRGYQLDAAYLSLTAHVAARALALAAANAQVAALNTIIADDKRNVDLVREALNAGSATRTQLLSARSQLESDRTLLPPLRQQQSTARHALAILVGRAPANYAPPDFQLANFTLPRKLAVSLPSELVHKRPDIRAAEAQLHVASAAIGVATANLYPHIDLTATLQQEALTPGGLFNGVAAAWSMAAKLTQPIFDGGQLSANRRAAVADYKAALASYRQTILTAFGQVSDQLQALSNDADEVKTQRAAVKSAVASRDLARRSYKDGYSGILDVIDAERQAARAELGLSRAQAQRLRDTVALYEALGGTPVPIQGVGAGNKG